MSERLPYEEQLPQQLRDFPLPDEDAAWADMKRRLEEDDDDGIIVWWRRGCAGWGLLLLALIVIGWWFFVKKDHGEEKTKTIITQQIGSVPDSGKSSGPVIQTDTVFVQDPLSVIVTDTVTDLKRNSIPGDSSLYKRPGKNNLSADQIKIHIDTVKRKAVDRKKSKKSTANYLLQRREKASEEDSLPATDNTGKNEKSISEDSTAIDRARLFIAGDSSITKKIDSVKKPVGPIKTDSTAKTNKLKSKSYFLSGGAGLNQQLPIAGQKAVPYGSQGRGFSFADYIPSVYLRFNKANRWFIQGEFRYGAPQYNKPLTYFQRNDTVGGGSRITERQLQKTYYHQLPVSFNLYITPEWAIGAGIVWNRFSKSVFQQSVRDPQSPADSFISKDIIVGKDPASEGLSTSYFQGLIESQYQWKKFSFGARYTFGLSPYLRFTLPGQPEQKESNRSLQLFIRYQLFKKKLNNSESP
ncbi:MAG: hypothetical protein DI535_03370 [Citrobacter freundii]|nr:MAG: hypothetical protein DI535_03370 [Citrobacter freundii]